MENIDQIVNKYFLSNVTDWVAVEYLDRDSNNEYYKVAIKYKNKPDYITHDRIVFTNITESPPSSQNHEPESIAANTTGYL